MMKKDFVTFLFPGCFVFEESTSPVDSWDADSVVQQIKSMEYKPFGFYFTTRSRGEQDLDSKVTATSNTYYLGGKVETLAEIKARGDKKDSILISNMESNKYPAVWIGMVTVPFNPGDVLLNI